MKLFTVLAFMLLVVPHASFASEGRAKVITNDINGNKMTLQMPSGVGYTNGSDLFIFDNSGHHCRVPIIDIQSGEATIGTLGCVVAPSVQEGDRIRVADSYREGTEDKSMATSGELDFITNNFNFLLGYSFAQNFDYSVALNTGTYSGSGALSLGARYARIPMDGFGFMGGLRYEFGRSLTSTTPIFLANSANLGFFLIEPNLAYGLGHGYAFAGPNFSLPLASDFPAPYALNGSFGLQVGVGFAFLDYLALEAEYRTVNFTGSINNTSYDYFRNWGIGFNLVFLLQ